jgi:hypothetical protein
MALGILDKVMLDPLQGQHDIEALAASLYGNT